jgi:hypothetical protein
VNLLALCSDVIGPVSLAFEATARFLKILAAEDSFSFNNDAFSNDPVGALS